MQYLFAPLPQLGWRYLQQDSELIVGEYLFRPGAVALLAVLLVAFLCWRTAADGGSGLAAFFLRHSAPTRWALIGTSVLVSLVVNLHVLGGLPHTQDEVAYFFQAQTYATNRLWVPLPGKGLLPGFQTVFLVTDDHRWYGKYPPGWPMCLSLGCRLGAPAIVNPALNGLALVLFHRLLARHWLSGWALAGLALLATSPFFVLMGASYLSHPFSLVLTLLLWEAWDRTLGPGPACVLGLGLGALLAIRPLDALTLGLPFGAALAYRCWRGSHGRALLAAALAVAVGIGATLGYNAMLTGNPFASPFARHHAGDTPGFGPDRGTFEPEGHNAYKALMNLTFNMLALREELFGWPALTLLVVLAGVVLPVAWTPTERLLLVVGAGVHLGYFTFVAHGVAFGPRYYHSLLPLYVWFTLRCLAEVERRLGRGWRPRLVVAVLSFSGVGLLTYWPGRLAFLEDYWNLLSHPQTLVRGLPTGTRSVVVVPDVKLHERDLFDSFFSLNDPDLAGPVVYVRDGPWVRDGRLAARFPGAKLLQIQRAAVSQQH